MAAGTGDFLVNPALVVSLLMFALRSERTAAIAGAVTVIAVLVAGHLRFRLHAGTGWADLAVVPWIALLDTDPDKARESLAHIQRASESALEELRLTVGLLRQPGGGQLAGASRVASLDE